MAIANEQLGLVTAKLSMCGLLTSGFRPGRGAGTEAGPVRMLPNEWLVGLRVYAGEISMRAGANSRGREIPLAQLLCCAVVKRIRPQPYNCHWTYLMLTRY